MGTTAELADFAANLRYDAIPDGVRAKAALAIIDSIGTVFAGLDEDSVRIARDFMLRESAEGAATLIGLSRKASASAAALANGAAAHALDYDSISLTVSGFIASPTLFSILALAERSGARVDGRRLVEAFVAGWEIEAAIARGLGVLHYSKGWHSTATLGHFGAAVGGAKLLGLDADGIRSAIGLAASEASGLRTMIGNMTNPFHVGKAARNGVTAAALAASGFRAEPNVIEHPYGVAVAFNGKGNFDLESMTDGLGEAWDLVDPGLVVKVYPCCGLVHSAIDAMLILREIEELRPEDVQTIDVAVHALVPPTMKFERPASGYEAKFSTPFCMATALAEGAVRLEHFTDQRTRDPKLVQVMDTVSMRVHPDLTEASTFLEKEFSEVTVSTTDGRRRTQRVDRIANRGSRGNPADLALVSAKFEDCVGNHPGRTNAMRALELLSQPTKLDDLRMVMELL
ncbi:MAG: MmgE/PrpD family protein [Rhizobiaceae bacterium]